MQLGGYGPTIMNGPTWPSGALPENSFITPLAATLSQAGLRLDVATANSHIGSSGWENL
jgi:hypothetical protein